MKEFTFLVRAPERSSETPLLTRYKDRGVGAGSMWTGWAPPVQIYDRQHPASLQFMPVSLQIRSVFVFFFKHIQPVDRREI